MIHWRVGDFVSMEKMGRGGYIHMFKVPFKYIMKFL